MTIQDSYTDTIHQTQQAWADLFRGFTADFGKVMERPAPFGDADTAIDQVFDFWAQSLEVQRDLAKKLAGVTSAVGQSLLDQANPEGGTGKPQGEPAATE